MKLFGMPLHHWWFYFFSARYLITAHKVATIYRHHGPVQGYVATSQVVQRAFIKRGSTPTRIEVTARPDEALCFGFFAGRLFLKTLHKNFPEAKRQYALVVSGDAWFLHHVHSTPSL